MSKARKKDSEPIELTVPEFRSPSSFPEYRELEERIGKIDAEKVQVSGVLRAAEAARAEGLAARNKAREQAEALVNGEEPGANDDVPSLEEIQTLRERHRVLDLASQVGKRRLGELRNRLSKEICQEAREDIAALWGQFVEYLVAASEVASVIRDVGASADSLGLTWTPWLPMAIPMEPWDGRLPDSRVNRQAAEVLEYWPELEIGRKALEEAEARKRGGLKRIPTWTDGKRVA